MKFYFKKRRMPIINIISLIDVFAILLIFFIVTTTFRVVQPQLLIHLPKSETAKDMPSKHEVALLEVNGWEEITLNNIPCTVDDLTGELTRLHENHPERALGLRIDKDVPFELVVKVLDSLKNAGIENIPAFTEALQ